MLASLDLEPGDRVRTSWMGETRTGVVAEIYKGVPNALGHFILQCSVTWDDNGRTERGYIVGVTLKKIGTIVATPF